MTDKPLTPEERLADWMLDHLAEYNRWMMTGWRETMRDEAVVLAGQMLDAARVAAPSDGLREQLRLQVDAWRELQKQTTGQKEADEGYAVGLGHAIFVVEELLADAALAATPTDD
jgi:hypothetical protein